MGQHIKEVRKKKKGNYMRFYVTYFFLISKSRLPREEHVISMVYISLRGVINLCTLLQTVTITLFCETKAWKFLIFGIIYWSCPWLSSNLIKKTVINILLWIFFWGKLAFIPQTPIHFLVLVSLFSLAIYSLFI